MGRISGSGMNGEKAQNMILNFVTKSKVVTSEDFSRLFIKTDVSSDKPVPEQMFYRALRKLIKEKKLVKERLQGSHTMIYYLPGKRPYIASHKDTSELDSLLIEVSKGIVKELMEQPHLFDRDLEVEISAISDRYGLDVPSFEYARIPQENDTIKLDTKLFSSFNLVREWEQRRAIKIPRPWDSTVPDSLLVNGPGTLEMLDILTRFQSKEWQSGQGMTIDVMPLQGDIDRLIESYHSKAGELPEREERHTYGRYPFINEWFQFYVNVIEAVSDYVKERKKAKKPNPIKPKRT